MNRLGVGLLAVLTVGWGGRASAQEAEAQFRSGNAAYQAGRFEEARDAYEGILAAGSESATLYYNLGNAYFKLGDLGKAVLSYERARRLDPGDEDIRANLDLANSLLADEITPLPGFLPLRVMRWGVEVLPRSLLLHLSGVGYVLAGLGAALWILIRGPRGRWWSGWVASAAAVVALLAGANLLARDWLAGQESSGVILADEVAVYSAPSEDHDLQLFTIHEGTKVRIDQESGEWAEVVLADGKVGWVHRNAFEPI